MDRALRAATAVPRGALEGCYRSLDRALRAFCSVLLLFRMLCTFASRQKFFFFFSSGLSVVKHAHVAHALRAVLCASPWYACFCHFTAVLCCALAWSHVYCPCRFTFCALYTYARTHTRARAEHQFFFREDPHTADTNFFFWGRSAMRYIFSHTTAALSLPLLFATLQP